jgi:hypothetical protein
MYQYVKYLRFNESFLQVILLFAKAGLQREKFFPGLTTRKSLIYKNKKGRKQLKPLPALFINYGCK